MGLEKYFSAGKAGIVRNGSLRVPQARYAPAKIKATVSTAAPTHLFLFRACPTSEATMAGMCSKGEAVRRSSFVCAVTSGIVGRGPYPKQARDWSGQGLFQVRWTSNRSTLFCPLHGIRPTERSLAISATALEAGPRSCPGWNHSSLRDLAFGCKHSQVSQGVFSQALWSARQALTSKSGRLRRGGALKDP